MLKTCLPPLRLKDTKAHQISEHTDLIGSGFFVTLGLSGKKAVSASRACQLILFVTGFEQTQIQPRHAATRTAARN